MNKVIVIDSGFFIHKAIFAWGAEKKRRLERGDKTDPLMASYTYLNMIYGTLKKIGIDRDDMVIVACDARNSWRKAFLEEYKGQRQGLRDANDHINWGLQYSLMNKIEIQLNDTTYFHFIKLEEIFNYADLALSDEGQELKIEDHGNISYDKEFGIEADDIQAVIPKFFPDKEIILVTIDKDLSQLVYYKNCKIFNPNLKSPTNKSKKGFYEIINDPLKIITSKVRSGDASDNILVDKKKDSERDVEVRKFIINLIKLPDFVEKPILKALTDLDMNKKVLYDQLPFPTSLGSKFDTIYDSKNIVTYKQSFERYLIKEILTMEKNSVKTPEELYKKSKKYKDLNDQLTELKNEKKKVKV